MAPSVTLRNFSYRYFEDAPPVFNNLSLQISAGSCCALLGPTGAGKTTLLQILSGVIGSQLRTGKATGSLSIGEQTFDPLPSDVLFPAVGYVMPDPFFQLSGIMETVRDEIGFTLDNIGIGPVQRDSEIRRIVKLLGLSPFVDRNPRTLSGGELQRVALASILVATPSLLLLDEPANALDSHHRTSLKRILRSLRGRATVLFSDTEIEFALETADHFVILDRGALIFAGSRQSFLESLHQMQHILPASPWLELLERRKRAPARIRALIGEP